MPLDAGVAAGMSAANATQGSAHTTLAKHSKRRIEEKLFMVVPAKYGWGNDQRV
jgi:hypothetical protein